MKSLFFSLSLLCAACTSANAQSDYDDARIVYTDTSYARPVLIAPDSLSSTSIIIQAPRSPRYADLSSTSISGIFLYDVALDSAFTSFIARNIYSKNPFGFSCQPYSLIIRMRLIKLKPATTYYYRLRALFDITDITVPHASRFSTTASFRTPLVSPPTIVTSIATLQLSHDAITLTWFPAEGKPTEYHVQVAKDSLFTNIVAGYDSLRVQVKNDTARSETQTRITGLQAGTRYYFRVRSRNAQGTSAFSPAIFDETFAQPQKFTARRMTYDEGLRSVSTPEVGVMGIKRVYLPKKRLSLHDADSIIALVVQKGIALETAWFQDSSSCRIEDRFTSVLSVKLKVLNSAIDSLQFGRSYTTSYASEEWLNCVCKNYRLYYNFDTQVSVQEPQPATAALNLEQNAPNPADDETNIAFELPNAAHVTLTLHNILGREVFTIADGAYTAGKHMIPLSLHHLPQGIYTYRLSAGGQTTTKQMLVVR